MDKERESLTGKEKESETVKEGSRMPPYLFKLFCKARDELDSVCSVTESQFSANTNCIDGDVHKQIRYLTSRAKMWRIILRTAAMTCAEDEQKWRHVLECFLELIGKARECLDSLINIDSTSRSQSHSLWHDWKTLQLIKRRGEKEQWRKEQYREKSGEICYWFVQIDELIKKEAEEVFRLPKFKPLISQKPQQVLGLFLNFLQATFSSMSPGMDRVGTVNEEFNSLIIFVGDTSVHAQYSESEGVKQIRLWDDIEAVANETGRVHYQLFIGAIKDMEADRLLSDIADKIHRIKKQIKIYVEGFQITPRVHKACNMTDGLIVGVADPLLDRLNELSQFKSDTILSFKDEIDIIQKELSLLSSALKSCDKGQKVDLAYLTETAECLLTFIDVPATPAWYLKIRLSHFIQEIEFLTEAIKLEEKRMDINAAPKAEPKRSRVYPTPKLIVDFPQEAAIKEHLTGAESALNFICIVGMPGLGKTTLAERLYENPAITSAFTVRARCSVTRAYTPKGLLLELLNSIQKTDPETGKMTEAEIGEILFRKLNAGRYLVFMDDLWSIDPWYELQLYLKDEGKGSRIIFTSRREDLVSSWECQTTYKLNFLSEKDSWHLLKHTLFENGKCPPELKEVGKEIIARCEGLPLAVNVIAGLLGRMDRQPSIWKQIANKLSTHVASEQNVREKILDESYEHTPPYLKPCFLYCSMFPEGKGFRARKLMQLWIAEGFVAQTGDTSSELASKEYLTELINRNLITIVDRQSNGSIKTCRMHALLHDFCSTKAQQENFLKKIYNDTFQLYGHYHRVAIIDPERKTVQEYQPFPPQVRSLLCVITYEQSCTLGTVSHLFQGLKFLKVLDLECVQAYGLPSGIDKLVFLKYLAIRGFNSLTPSESKLRNLQNLETCVLLGHMAIMKFEVLRLPKLQHLRLSGPVGGVSLTPKDWDDFSDMDSFSFHRLQTLGTLCITSPEDEDNLKRFQNLRKLKCQVYKINDGATSRFPKMNFLTHLESMSIDVHARWGMPCIPTVTSLALPSSLRQLSISLLHLPWKEMSAVGRLLPNLEVLKIRREAFTGEEWDMEADEVEFSSLKFLKFQEMKIKRWNVIDCERLSVLETLVIENCEQMEELPEAFGFIYTIQRIDIKGRCRSSLVASAMQLREELSGQVEVRASLQG